ALKELRTYSYLMHPPALHADGLRSTLRKYIGGYADRSRLSVEFRSSPKADKLALRMQRALLRIVQEALANVHHHASASHVAVELRYIAGRLHLTVSDNGRGMCEPTGTAVPLTGPGLSGIKVGVSLLAGHSGVRSRPHD